MKPIEYIYKNIDCLNTAILKQLIEDAGENVSENIYNYLMETTWNTNPAILKEFGLDIIKTKENKNKVDIKTIIVDQYGSLTNDSDFNNAADVYTFLENNGTDYLIVKDSDQKVYDLDYKGSDSYNYIYTGGQEFQIIITSSNIQWFSND